ncbi:MAG: hypothetical protein R2712_13085 [Vicinamibacterales bacterium]
MHEPVNAVVRQAVERLSALGAVVEPVRLPDLAALTNGLSLMSMEFADAMAAYWHGTGTARRSARSPSWWRRAPATRACGRGSRRMPSGRESPRPRSTRACSRGGTSSGQC